MYKCFYYVCSSSFGYYVLRDCYALPVGMGGSGSMWHSFKDFPYIEQSLPYTLYFTGTMGYHVGGLIN